MLFGVTTFSEVLGLDFESVENRIKDFVVLSAWVTICSTEGMLTDVVLTNGVVFVVLKPLSLLSLVDVATDETLKLPDLPGFNVVEVN